MNDGVGGSPNGGRWWAAYALLPGGLARDVTAGSLTVGRIQMAIVPGTTNIDSGIVDGTPVRTWFYRSGLSWVALKVAKVSWN